MLINWWLRRKLSNPSTLASSTISQKSLVLLERLLSHLESPSSVKPFWLNCFQWKILWLPLPLLSWACCQKELPFWQWPLSWQPWSSWGCARSWSKRCTLWKPWLVSILFVWIRQEPSPKEKWPSKAFTPCLNTFLKKLSKLFSLPICKILRITTQLPKLSAKHMAS